MLACQKFSSLYNYFLDFSMNTCFVTFPPKNTKVPCLKLNYIPKKHCYICYLDEKMLYMLAFLKMLTIIAFFSPNNSFFKELMNIAKKCPNNKKVGPNNKGE